MQRHKLLALWAAAIALLLPGLVQADPPSVVARLGYLNGVVSFSPAGEDVWLRAALNRPLITGDRLWVPPGNRTELQTIGAVVRWR